MNYNPTSRAKNVADLKRAGTFRKDRHGQQRTPIAPPGRPTKPDNLDAIAGAVWDSVITALDNLGNVHIVDGLAVYQYACLYAETEGIARQQAGYRATFQALDSTVPGLTGADLAIVAGQLGRLAKIDAKCTDQLRNGRAALRLYLTEFGLTPASRSRIRVSEPTPDVADPFLTLASRRPT
jgi:phage terminase small subunit